MRIMRRRHQGEGVWTTIQGYNGARLVDAKESNSIAESC
jgi:hypothetical protein